MFHVNALIVHKKAMCSHIIQWLCNWKNIITYMTNVCKQKPLIIIYQNSFVKILNIVVQKIVSLSLNLWEVCNLYKYGQYLKA